MCVHCYFVNNEPTLPVTYDIMLSKVFKGSTFEDPIRLLCFIYVKEHQSYIPRL